jgi:hypothetical protein
MSNNFTPIDIDFPTNYPGSTEIPLPSGLLQDLNISVDHVLEANLRGSIQGWAWTGARTDTAAAPSTLVPIKNHGGSTGYRNPITTSTLYDFSTVGLQVSGQVASNTTAKPVVIAIPYYFPDTVGDRLEILSVDITLGVFNANTAGMAFSLGYVAWGQDSTRVYSPPSDFAEFYDKNQATPYTIIFNINPDFEFDNRTKYVEAATSITSDIKLLNLSIPCQVRRAHGYILISAVSVPTAAVVTGGFDLTNPADFNWITSNNNIYDANHINIFRSHSSGALDLFDYNMLFTDNSASTIGLTGGKKFWLLQFLRPPSNLAPTFPDFSYHTVLQVRARRNLANGEYSVSSSTVLFQPNIDLPTADNVALLEAPNWELNIFPMAYAIISSIFIKTEVTLADIDQEPYGTGMPGTASTFNRLVTRLNKAARIQGSSSPCSQRVKGNFTFGSLAAQPATEKNEVFPWLRYNTSETYGTTTPGELVPINYSSYAFEGWNSYQGIMLADSTTPYSARVTQFAANFSLNILLEANSIIDPLFLNYGIRVGANRIPGFDIADDNTIKTIPFDQDNYLDGMAAGITLEQATFGGSFNPCSLADRFCNYLLFPNSYYRIQDLYPIGDITTVPLRISGIMNNFTTAGGLDYDTLRTVFPVQLVSSSINKAVAYAASSLANRGQFEVGGLGTTGSGLTQLDNNMIFTFYGTTMSPVFTEDPS